MLSSLITHHKKEILDIYGNEFNTVIEKTFNKEFQNMIFVSIFVPFLHYDTPKPTNIVKIAENKD